MDNNTQTSPADALLKVASGLEILAKTIEDAGVEQQQKVANSAMALNDYGSLGEQRPMTGNPLIDFLTEQ